jgi:hypothetical protein
MRRQLLYMSLALLVATGCKQTYAPPAVSHPPDYLVVEGFIESNGVDPTVFQLSHTLKLDSNTYTPEPGATVAVEDSMHDSYPLTETQPGTYYLPSYPFNNNSSYRLHIRTAGGKEYASDYAPLVYNPPIDSITFVRIQSDVHDGVQVHANTHDPQNNTHYYRWKYQETWQFHSVFEEAFVYVPGQGLVGAVGLNNYVCWHYDSSTAVVLGSTAQLGQDIVFHAPLVFIPNGSQQMTVRYSILVKQYALNKDAFAWWQTLQKNTEQIGSIFGVQPSANPGNIHCLTDTTEQVLGYISGGNTDSKRIFITNDQIQPWKYITDCPDMPVKGNVLNWIEQGYLIWQVETATGIVHLAYKTCVDCTLTGTNQKPSFW